MATQSPAATLAEAKFLRDELTDLVQRAQSFAGASGCILATLHEDRLLVCARAGAAPEIGSAIPVAGSLMGRAVQSGRTMRSQAAESEAAADVVAFRPLRVRSLAVIPLGDTKRAVRGVIAVLSENTPAFNNTQMAILRTLADVAAEKIQQQQGGVALAPPKSEPLSSAPTSPPSLTWPKPQPATPSSAPSTKPQPATSAGSAAAAPTSSTRISAPGPAPGFVATPSFAESRADAALPTQPQAAEVEPLAAAVTPSGKAGRPSKPISIPSTSASEMRKKSASAGDLSRLTMPRAALPPRAAAEVPIIPTIDGLARQRSSLSRLAIPAGIIGSVLIAGVLWSYNRRSEMPAPKPVRYIAVPISKEALEKTSAAEPPAASPDHKPEAPAAQPRAEQEVSVPRKIAASDNRRAATENKAGTEIKPAATVSKAAAKPPQPEKVAEIVLLDPKQKTKSQSEKPDSAKGPVVSKSALVNERHDAIRRPLALEAQAGEAPLPGSEISMAGNVIPVLPSPKVSMPVAPTSQLVPATLFRRFPPNYPATARQLGLQGIVVLHAQISREGRVTNVKVIKGEALLTDAAIAAVKQWRYKPAQLNGSPTESEAEIVLNFKIPK